MVVPADTARVPLHAWWKHACLHANMSVFRQQKLTRSLVAVSTCAVDRTVRQHVLTHKFEIV